MRTDIGTHLHLLKRAGVKLVYETIVNAERAVAGLETDMALRSGRRPLSAPRPRVDKADRIRKVVLAVMRYDFRYGNSTGVDYHYFYEPLCDVADVVLFDTSSFSRLGRGRMNEEFLRTVEREDPDLVLSCIVKDELRRSAIRKVSEECRAITCNWFADDHWRFDYFGKRYAPAFNYCVTVDEASLHRYRRLGYGNIFMSQWGANKAIYHPLDGGACEADVSFVGQNYSNRASLVGRLRRKGTDVKCFGDGWSRGWVPFERMVELYNRSKVNLNFSGSAMGPRRQVKARVFDIPACRGFLLTEDAPGLGDYYRVGKEIESFSSVDEALEKISYYLDDEAAREAIAEAGYQRTLREHTYQSRFRKLFGDILSMGHLSDKP